MSADLIRENIRALLKRAPKPERIATYNNAHKFKLLARKGQSLNGKGLEFLTDLYNQLRAYYE